MSKRKIQAHYRPRMSGKKKNFDVLDWASAESQRRRFAVLAASIDLEGCSLLDVGCGLGDLWGFLKERRISVDYTGVDILDEMVQAARKHHEDGCFVHADIFAGDIAGGGEFDVVFCSGTFNLNVGNNREFLPVAIARLLELSRRYVVFNLLRTLSRKPDPTYFYYKPREVQKMLRPLPCKIDFIDDYLPNDFTVICRV